MSEWDVYCAICGGPFTGIRISRKRDRGAQADHDQDTPDDEHVNVLQEEDEAESLDEYYENRSYDPEVISQEDVEWARELHVLGFNPDGPGIGKTFLSGPGEYVADGDVSVDEGEDPNFPEDHVLSTCYVDYTEKRDPIFPFHLCCYELLAKCLTDSFDYETLNQDLLFNVMQNISGDGSGRLELDYGIDFRARDSDSFWESLPGEEFLVSHPKANEEFKQLLLDKFVLNEFIPVSSKHDFRSRTSNDPFNKLPYELLLKVLHPLSTQDTLNLANASLAVHSALENNNGFWRQHIHDAMAWFFELDELLIEAKLFENRDVKRVCLWVNAITTPRKYIRGPFMALANRRRIWDVCQQLASRYIRGRVGVKGLSLESVDEWLQSASCVHMPVVSFPLARKKDMARHSFWIAHMEDMHIGKKIVETFWDLDGSLVGLSVALEGQERNLIGIDDSKPDVTVESAEIDENNWITGLILHIPEMGPAEQDPSTDPKGVTVSLGNFESVSSADCSRVINKFGALHFGKTEAGYPKRPLVTSKGWHAVGLIGQTGTFYGKRHILRLGLLQVDESSFDDESETSNSSDGDELPTPSPLQRWLWSHDRADILGEPIWDSSSYRLIWDEEGHEVPSYDSQLFGDTRTHRDVVPLEALVWARDRTELYHLERLSGYHASRANDGPDLCGIAAEFNPQFNKERRVIGTTCGKMVSTSPEQHVAADKEVCVHDSTTSDTGSNVPGFLDPYVHFDIDGPGGEYVTEVLRGSRAIKLRTNRGREVQWGRNNVDHWKSIAPSDGETIVGICMTFAEPAGLNGVQYTYARFGYVLALTMRL